MKKQSKLVKKSDYNRVLLTETSPYEVPAIFSNIGLYNNLKDIDLSKKESFIASILANDMISDYTISLNYQIRKDLDSYRTLSLIHPSSQINIVSFYKEFSNLIVSYCSKSNFSIRAPSRIASKYYLRNKNMLDKEFAKGEPQSESGEKKYKHLASYFSYNRYTRLHKFFNSKEFINLEKRYEIFCSIDIAKCFDSIYTHSITWAVKNKDYSKNNTNVKNSFGTLFDRLMQSLNYNETAGIVIGPEVSRVFSEIIFQEIDREIENRLSELGYTNEKHYTIRRYVDDIFIFSLDEVMLDDIRLVIGDTIKKYKLSINKQKISLSKKPFSTIKTNIINELNDILNSLKSKFIDSENPKKIKKIYSKDKTVISYLGKIKSLFSHDRENYNLAAGYTISSLTNIAISIDRNIIEDPDYYNENMQQINDFLSVSMEIILHLFFISPSHSSSVKICIMIDLIRKIYEQNCADGEEIKGTIYNLIHSYFERLIIKKENSKINNTSLEDLNLLISIKLLGDEYKLSTDMLSNIISLKGKDNFTYFEIITILYYIGNDSYYNRIKTEIEKYVKRTLTDITDIKINAFKCYLFLDYINCPYIEKTNRRKIVSVFLKSHFMRQPTEAEINDGWEQLTKSYWFVQWDNINLRLFLEKKELLNVY